MLSFAGTLRLRKVCPRRIRRSGDLRKWRDFLFRRSARARERVICAGRASPRIRYWARDPTQAVFCYWLFGFNQACLLFADSESQACIWHSYTKVNGFLYSPRFIRQRTTETLRRRLVEASVTLTSALWCIWMLLINWRQGFSTTHMLDKYTVSGRMSTSHLIGSSWAGYGLIREGCVLPRSVCTKSFAWVNPPI